MTRQDRDWTDTVWPSLFAAWLMGFGVAEYLATRADPARHPHRKTLSRAMARWFGVHPRRRHCRAIEVGLVLSLIGLLVHVEKLPPLIVVEISSEPAALDAA